MDRTSKTGQILWWSIDSDFKRVVVTFAEFFEAFCINLRIARKTWSILWIGPFLYNVGRGYL